MQNIFRNFIFSILLISCKDNSGKTESGSVKKANIETLKTNGNSESHKEEFNYELEDSDESYVMDDWNERKRNDYYNKTGNLIAEFLSWGNYKPPTAQFFSEQLKDQFNINIVGEKLFIKIPFCNLEEDQNSEDNLIILTKQRIVSFESELPLLNKASIKFYHSKDYQSLDHSQSYNLVINKLIFGDIQETEIIKYLSDSSLKDLFYCLVVNHHYSKNDKVLNYVIQTLIKEKNEGEEINIDDIKSLAYKKNKGDSTYVIDNDFLKKIAKIDKNKTLLSDFLSIAKYKLEQNYRRKIIKTIKDDYAINE